jgi:SAM-dependent methyltransferase
LNIDIDTDDHAVSALLQSALGLAAPVNTTIHHNDQMFTFIASSRGSDSIARSDYFTSGSQLFETLGQLVQWRFGSFDNLTSLLDFASGYGRLTRFLVQKLPPDRIWVSDIQADAVAFQQSEFGVRGFVSTADPDVLLCDQTFDCILVASLFSHLPPTTFTRWLKKLCSLLKPGGLLAFTVHDASRLPSGEKMPESGIWFSEASEIASVDTKDYGVAVVSEAFVRTAIVEATGRPLYRRVPYGLHFHQDIYLVVNEPSPDFAGLHFAHLPHGGIDYALWRGMGTLNLRGWAADMAGAASPVEVQIFADGQLRQKCIPSMQRPDVRNLYNDERFLNTGWDCSFDLPSNDSTRLIVVKAISSRGVESLLFLGTIASLLPVGKAETCLWLKPGQLYVKGWATDTTGTGSPVEVQVFADGQLQQKCIPSTFRPELEEHFNDDRFLRAGWECSFRLPNDAPDQLIEVKTISGGNVSLLYSGTVASLHALGDIAFAQQRETLLRLQAELDGRLDYIHHLEAELARKDAALASLEAGLRRRSWQRLSPFR